MTNFRFFPPINLSNALFLKYTLILIFITLFEWSKGENSHIFDDFFTG